MGQLSNAFYQYIEEFVPDSDILKQEPMSKHTTFRIGGEASCLIQISSEEQLQKLVVYLSKVGIPYYILGNGSNLLVSDKGYDGVILKLSDRFQQIEVDGTKIKAKAGALLPSVSRAAMKAGLAGMEFAAGIPGTIGGGTVMNAGAYDGEMKQVVESVRVLSREGEILEFDNNTMEFSYRNSIIKKHPFIILEVTLKLQEGDPIEIQKKMEDFNSRRREKQPLEYPSAGSTFKRPEGYFAGKLIMDAGLRGYRIGGAKVAEKHCGFIVNEGNASAADVADVIASVQEIVKERFGVTLEKEIICLGEF